MKKIVTLLASLLLVAVTAMFASCNSLPDPTKDLTPSVGLEMKLNTEIEDLTYEGGYTIEETEYYVVTGIGTCTDTDIVVPSTYNGKPVKAIGGFFGNSNINSVVLPNSIEVIRALAFGRCTGMTKFDMGNGVKIVEHCAFGTASSLTNLIFSKQCEFIGWECFHHAAALTTLNLPKSIKTIDYSILNGVLFETVNFAGSEADWNKIDVNSNNSELLGAEFNFNAKF